jgi:hypothetical protein
MNKEQTDAVSDTTMMTKEPNVGSQKVAKYKNLKP